MSCAVFWRAPRARVELQTTNKLEKDVFFLNANSYPAREEISSDDGGGPLLLIMEDQETLRFSFKKISLCPKVIIKSNFFRQILILYFLCSNSFIMIQVIVENSGGFQYWI